MNNSEKIQEFLYGMKVNGAFLFEEVVPLDLCRSLKKDIFHLYENTVRQYQIDAGLADIAQWSVHHICGRKDSIHDFLLADYFHDFITAYFGGKHYILNSIGAAINPPATEAGSYEHGHRWHRDARTFVGDNDMRQMIVAVVILDEARIEHGALEILKGSHRAQEFPGQKFVDENKFAICGAQGSVILFDGDVWHRVGKNLSKDFFVVVTCVFSRPFLKQGMDYPRFFDPDYSAALNPRMRQLFGFNSRTPASYAEWYQPSEKRFYKQDQE